MQHYRTLFVGYIPLPLSLRGGSRLTKVVVSVDGQASNAKMIDIQ
jgi:hypothetical protein